MQKLANIQKHPNILNNQGNGGKNVIICVLDCVRFIQSYFIATTEMRQHPAINSVLIVSCVKKQKKQSFYNKC